MHRLLFDDLEVRITGHHLLPLADGGDTGVGDGGGWLWNDRMLAAHDTGGTILTGVWSGTVRVSAENWLTPPPLQLGDWEDVSEATIRTETGHINLVSEYGALTVPALLTPDGKPGLYHIRVHARGRAVNFDMVVESSGEEYQIQVWPVEPASGAMVGQGITHLAKSGR